MNNNLECNNNLYDSITLEAPTHLLWEPTKPLEKQVIVMMSGGVDSSVTALILKEQGYDVLGITMRIPVAKSCDFKRSCCGIEAAYVSKQLNIPHMYLSIQDAFHEHVIKPFQESYKNGIPPSPCVDCNETIKFKLAWDYLTKTLGIKYLATGHYAKIYSDEKGFHLACGDDISRDQSYFLYGIKKEKLPYLLFPLEGYSKDEVREMAQKARLKVATKQDSMELCFAGEGDYRNALEINNNKPGIIKDTSGKILKEHKGIENFTIGQRKGLGVSAPYPLYVIDINPYDYSVTLGKYEEGLTKTIRAHKLNILEPERAVVGYTCYGKIRSTGSPNKCKIVEISDDKVLVEFEKEFFITSPGQKLVLYDKNEDIILGGTILK